MSVGPPQDVDPFTAFALVCAVVAAGFQVVAIHGQSLSGDGAQHLLAGHQAVRYGENRLNLEHPPLVKLVMALPLMLEDKPLAPPLGVGQTGDMMRRAYSQPQRLHRARVRGRYLVLVGFVLPMLGACFALGRRFGGERAARCGAVLVFMVAFSFDILPHLTILQTDTAVTLAYLLTLLAAIRYLEAPTWGRTLAVGLAFGLALSTKFSGLLLLPVVVLALALASGPSVPRRLARLAVLGLVSLAVVDFTYAVANRDYTREHGREAIRGYCRNEASMIVEDRLRPWEGRLLAVERYDPFMAQWLTGLLSIRAQNAVGPYPSYIFGEVRSRGRWWYFPVVAAIKTPWVVLALVPAMLAAWWRRRGLAVKSPAALLVAVVVAVYLGMAMTSNYNLGVRHLLPILPLLYLPLAWWVARRRLRSMLVIAVLALESWALAPLWMSATNTWWLGSKNPTRWALSRSDLDYGQNFIQLARYAEKHGLEPLHVLHSAGEPEVIRAYDRDARVVRPGDPVPPGWYAVAVTLEQYVPAILRAPPGTIHGQRELYWLARRWQTLLRRVAQGEDHGYVAGSFHLYRLGTNPGYGQ